MKEIKLKLSFSDGIIFWFLSSSERKLRAVEVGTKIKALKDFILALALTLSFIKYVTSRLVSTEQCRFNSLIN